MVTKVKIEMKKLISVMVAVIMVMTLIPFSGSEVHAVDDANIIQVNVSSNLNKITLNPAYSEAEVVTAFRNNISESTSVGYSVDPSDAYIAYRTSGKWVYRDTTSSDYIRKDVQYYLCYGVTPKSGYKWPDVVKNIQPNKEYSFNDYSFKSGGSAVITFTANGSSDSQNRVTYDSSSNKLYVFEKIDYKTIDISQLDGVSITNINNVMYDGTAKKQDIVMKRGGFTFEEGVDFEPRYTNHTNVGRATITIRGKGYFKGKLDVYFYITKTEPTNSEDNNYYSDETAKNNDSESGSGDSGSGSGSSTGSGTGSSSASGSGAAAEYKGTANTASGYKDEWVKGKWYNSQGVNDYKGTLEWKSDSTGWWVEDSAGWYPVSQWQKIDGKWYYFTASGYMDYSEYRDGYWLGSDGALVDGYYGQWKSDSTGWWFEDTSGWYPSNQYVWIDGTNYYFNASGYWS